MLPIRRPGRIEDTARHRNLLTACSGGDNFPGIGSVRVHHPEFLAEVRSWQVTDSRSIRGQGCSYGIIHNLLRLAAQQRDFIDARSPYTVCSGLPVDSQDEKMRTVREPVPSPCHKTLWQGQGPGFASGKLAQVKPGRVRIGDI